MRISYEWLSDFVDLSDVTPQHAAEVLTRLGVEIEAVSVIDLSNILIGRILTQTPHPKSRNPLWIHQVDLGDHQRTIIAGAPNAIPGSLVPVALPGTVTPSGKEVRDINIAGVPAKGMLCSEAELLLSDDHSGIMLLEEGAPGERLSDYFPLEAVLHAEVTSNRPDCLGHLGVARELAAGLDRPLKREFMPSFLGDAEPAGTTMVEVGIDDPDLCARYIGAVITGVRVGESPRWLQRRLRSAGVRPINNVVDVTNYVLLEYGQPLHTFDLGRLAGPRIEVRRARAGESLHCLDGVTRDLGPEMLVIADAERPVAVAGVMGGEESGVSAATVDVLLEAANFEAPSVRMTARALGLRTEASSRFEKRLPPELALAGARRGAALLAQLAGGRVHREWPDVYPRRQEPIAIRVEPASVDALLGVHVPLEEAEAILRRLGFNVETDQDGSWDLLAPVFRLDVVIPEDVAEEVGRVYGYERVQPTLPGRRRSSWTPARVSRDRRLDAAREVLSGAGLHEVVTPALLPARVLESLGLAARAVRITNALSDEMDCLRTSLVPSLLQVARHNRNHGNPEVGVYEVGAAYLGRGPGTEQPAEPLRIGALLAAGPGPDDGRAAFLRLKAVMDRIAADVEAPAPAYSRETAAAAVFHPGRTAAVSSGGRRLGVLGELHPTAVAEFDLAGRWVVLEVDAMPLLELSAPVKAVPPPRYPAVLRDLAVVVPEEVEAASVLDVAGTAGGPLLASVSAFDEYRGSQLPEGRKSLALALTFRSAERTLTDGEVDDRMAEIRRSLGTRLGAGFRE